MIAALHAEKECQEGRYQTIIEVPLIKDYVQYNYVDCKVMEELVTYARNKVSDVSEIDSDSDSE